MKTKDLTIQALLAAVYVAVSLALQPLSFGPIQVRLAECTLLLLLVNKKHMVGIILGCFITNLFSPLGMADVVFGTLATAITCYAMVVTKNDVLKLLWPAIINGLIVGAELTFIFQDLPFFFNAFYVFAGEIAAVFIPGMILKDKLKNNATIQNYFG
ncbi:QueT transporter family protein [Erysipelothrix sp. HDW6C]|uniref:QueT transporter family protein n=1 Tax=Erysipelothrix sp. HDW6C TaxID=2714930 RepID=UPI00140D0E27|nr:QueT transporter family protein [Erysipelothrix sp. HDW6C]QIK69032.1 QueT transporter family protein [Erysipelothrix sp. HDW6C]